mmetsp:Transcript_21891/g.52085  ORF Transcript_21891/g.52085 Transcript_21891/m.52085 type:complete len:1010 (+) Transcript_21891:107-3136(+)
MTKLSPKTRGNPPPFGSSGIPTFVKPVRVRNISNLSFDNGEISSHSNANLSDTASSGGITYGAQSALPRLPVPSLKETMAKFLKTLQALEVDGDPEERLATETAIRDFLVETRDSEIVTGPALQELLLVYDKIGRETGSFGSYVEEFWSDAYLAPDSSVVLNLNPYFLLEESPDPNVVGDQIQRAARLCFASIKMASELRNETLKPDTIRGKTLCMAQFHVLFGSARIPKARSKDTIVSNEKANHVAVLCGNQFFYFQALWPDSGEVAVDEKDLVRILEAIKDHATKPGSDNKSQWRYQKSLSAVGVLTSLERNQWAKAREEIINYSTKNADAFRAIDAALFVLVLDDYLPKTKQDAAANMLHGHYELTEITSEGGKYCKAYQSGSCTNRWYDKLQIIVTADGGAGINFEHSAIDGHTALRLVSDIYADTVISFAKSITRLVHAHDGLIPSVINANVRRAADMLDNQGQKSLDVAPKKIIFDLSDTIKRKIYFAETALGDHISAIDTCILEFKDYGKHFITFNRLSPDAFVQMSMMLAYYRLYGKIVCAYEPVLTKAFYHGRTEAMRPATMEAKHLCETFCCPTSSARDKLGALRNATIAHSKLVKECAKGKGVDRHLFALKCIAEKKGLPMPAFFRSEGWKKLNHTVLSTSNCGNPSLALFGFGPVVPDGYGIGYIIKDSQIHYTISSKHRQTARFVSTLEGVLRELASLLQPMSSTKVDDHSSRNSPPNTSSITVSTDSYRDLWGESSFQTSVDDGRPEVIHEATAKERWNHSVSGDVVAAEVSEPFFNQPIKKPLNDATDPGLYLSPPIKAPLNDVSSSPTGIMAIPEDRRKVESKRRQRRGSNDLMPIRPDRRSSVSTIIVKKSDLVDLTKLGNESGQKSPPAKLDDYLEENKNADGKDLYESAVFHESGLISEQMFVSPPITPPLNDEVDAIHNSLPAMTPIPEDRRTMGSRQRQRRGSNDMMPIRPDRRSSVSTLMLGKGDLANLKQLADESDEKPQQRGDNQ